MPEGSLANTILTPKCFSAKMERVSGQKTNDRISCAAYQMILEVPEELQKGLEVGHNLILSEIGVAVDGLCVALDAEISS